MKTLLGMDQNRRKLIFEQADAKMNLAPVSVEKDFWVCWTLEKLFKLTCGNQLTFKGGTSLSKAWGLIERFSEDIDITIHRDFLGFGGDRAPHEAVSKSQQKKRLEALKTACEQYIAGPLFNEMQAAIADDLTASDSWSLRPSAEDSQTLLFDYPSVFPTGAQYLRRWVQIEMGGRADVEPSSQVAIQPYVAKVFPNIITDASVEVRVLLPVRTFWEKAMLLHEEGFRPDSKPRKNSLARHYYDIYRMIQAGAGEQALAEMDLFYSIATQREQYFGYSWVDYKTHLPGKLRILPADKDLPAWLADYNGMRHEMFFGEVPAFEEVLKEVKIFQDKFNCVE